jgi:hypothetical protein
MRDTGATRRGDSVSQAGNSIGEVAIAVGQQLGTTNFW